MIQIDRGHFWITFENGYTVSVFNGLGSYSTNHFDTDCLYLTDAINSKNCEVAITKDNNFVTKEFFPDLEDDVMGYVSPEELVDIINKVRNYKGE